MNSIKNSTDKAIKTGITSGFIQVSSLLWLRTVNNYQYRYGSPLIDTFKILYKNGGVLRFYRGYIPSIFVASSCKFGELNAYYYSKEINLNSIDRLLLISSVSSIVKLSIVPVDTLDVFLQVEGKQGVNILYNKIQKHGIKVLYYGVNPWIINNFIGTFSWFGVHNYLDNKYINNETLNFNIKNGLIGLSASVTSDILTNPLRILKVNKQSHSDNVSYLSSVKNIIKNDGISEFLFRGLKTRLLIHGIQNIFFTIIWKNIEKKFNIN